MMNDNHGPILDCAPTRRETRPGKRKSPPWRSAQKGRGKTAELHRPHGYTRLVCNSAPT